MDISDKCSILGDLWALNRQDIGSSESWLEPLLVQRCGLGNVGTPNRAGFWGPSLQLHTDLPTLGAPGADLLGPCTGGWHRGRATLFLRQSQNHARSTKQRGGGHEWL